ncbi:MAG: hypothetical protein DDT23_01198 [candidate division WS2 bacterium]|nr:hypothetical protein [Candidatus Lithacetigena glycinireducens]
MGFEKLSNIIEVELSFKTLSSLSIQAGDQPQTVAESPIIKLGGEPIIPGSSLKGALRSSLEGLLSAKGKEVCVPLAAIPKEHRRQEEDRKKYVKGIGRKEPCDPANTVCPVCEIFGTTGGNKGLSGSAIFQDANVINYSPEQLLERSHVAITRDTHSQASGSLMTNETIDKGSKFKGIIRFINPKEWQVGAILQAIEWLKQLGIGSKKTAGYGQLEITVESIKLKELKDGKWVEVDKNEKTFIDAFVDKLNKAG